MFTQWVKKILASLKSFLSGLGLLGLIAGLIYAFARRPDSGVEVRQRDRARRTEDEKAIQDTQKTAGQERLGRARRNENRRARLIAPAIILALVLGHSVASAGHSASKPIIPNDYATLKANYLELWEISEEWRALYQEAEASVAALQESNARLLAIIEEQRVEIERLKRPRLGFGGVGGVLWNPAGPGVFLGASVHF